MDFCCKVSLVNLILSYHLRYRPNLPIRNIRKKDVTVDLSATNLVEISNKIQLPSRINRCLGCTHVLEIMECNMVHRGNNASEEEYAASRIEGWPNSTCLVAYEVLESRRETEQCVEEAQMACNWLHGVHALHPSVLYRSTTFHFLFLFSFSLRSCVWKLNFSANTIH